MEDQPKSEEQFYYARLLIPPTDNEKRPLWRTITIQNENGVFTTWNVQDRSWKKITPAHANILRSHRLQPIANSPFPFEIRTEAEVDASAKEERRRQMIIQIQRAPGVENAVDLTDPRNPVQQIRLQDKEQYSPAAEIDSMRDRVGRLENLILRQNEMIQQLVQARSDPAVYPVSSAFAGQPASQSSTVQSREAALGLEDQPAPDPEPALDEIPGIGEKTAKKLHEAGIISLSMLQATDPEELAEITDRSEEICKGWINNASKLLGE